MEGVTVLFEEFVYKFNDVYMILSDLSLFTSFIAFCGVIAFMILLDIFSSGTRFYGIAGMVLCGLLSIALILTSILMNKKYEESKEFLYCKQKVLVEEQVNLVEFSRHYEILSQEGKIYVVAVRTSPKESVLDE